MATIEEIQAELSTGSYSSDPLVALTELRTSGVKKQGAAPAGDTMAYLAQIGKLVEVKTIAATSGHPLQNASEAVMVTVNGRTQFDVHEPEVQAMLQGFVDASVITNEQRGAILALGQSDLSANVTISQVMKAMELTNAQTVNNWSVGGYLVIDVLEEVTEPFNPYLTRTNSFEVDEPIGRSKRITKQGKHVIDLRGLVSPIEPSAITVELNAPYSFNIELR